MGPRTDPTIRTGRLGRDRAPKSAPPQQQCRHRRTRASPHPGPASRPHGLRTGRWPGHHRLAPRTRTPARPVDLHDPPDPAQSRPDHPRTEEAPQKQHPPVRSRPTQRNLAIRFSPASGRCPHHWPLADGSDVEILNWLDDHSRLLLSATAHRRVTAALVVDSFTTNITTYGPPASTLTDNGLVFTTCSRGARNAFEYLLAPLGIEQKNGQPFPPPGP